MARDSAKTPSKKTHEEMVAVWMKDPAFRKGYEALDEEFEIIKQIVMIKKRLRITQAAIAKQMGTHASAVNRLELSLGNGKHSPSLNTLRKYAKALGCKIEIKFKPLNK